MALFFCWVGFTCAYVLKDLWHPIYGLCAFAVPLLPTPVCFVSLQFACLMQKCVVWNILFFVVGNRQVTLVTTVFKVFPPMWLSWNLDNNIIWSEQNFIRLSAWFLPSKVDSSWQVKDWIILWADMSHSYRRLDKSLGIFVWWQLTIGSDCR